MTDLLEQAVAAHRAGNLPEAEQLYRAALAQQPDRADAHYNLAMICGQQGHAADAAQELLSAVKSRPDFGEAWFMLCEFADQIGQQELNCLAGEQATRLMPDRPRAWLRYGLALSRLGQDEEAIGAYRSALALDPALLKASINLSVALKNIGQAAEAEQVLRKALKFSDQALDESRGDVDENEYGFLHWYLALAELALGKYREGFAHFRARFKGGTDWQRLPTAQPLWRGEDLRGKAILITVEQGHGDALMLCRYLPLLKERGARVIFSPHAALAPLFKNWPGADEIAENSALLASSFDYHASIFDLPHRFGTMLTTIPAHMPYLPVPEPDAKTYLKTDGRPRVGIVWAGQPDHPRDKERSIPLAIFADLFTAKDWQFFSLTRDLRPGDNELMTQHGVSDLAPLIGDFADGARFMNQLDLIITCDTAAAHLAGGMGKKVWTLLPFAPDWRWLAEREDSPWYPTMRLFRQRQKGDWAEVVARVKAALQEEKTAIKSHG